ncbi:MFS general substrate transporter [Aureobasidium pullulans]|uniref:MFS general substrate transporter n=3 Tax=Aureobasidium pullulans TaxID=5580 RepID=A0A074XJV6_AURPU|nr:MFS general substrate transporter [Aureobasidium pullulans EXF-150]THV71429.1 MFS general substrate transporter [Aureobasidium pullulans]KEQ83964.1 MFS general substrate transporter [Aureobasidium pullulans EXF-150]THV99124.1 MFS general substrate transporter [Aureobasidium pullulans]THW73998.1 MFS general substrate transporter [Aureobasidium pullulans]THW91529.1 MFS general substrate transporter [Aureobasidium pullulans]
MTTEDENDRRQATETSPLLGKQGPKPIDPSDGIVPDSAVTNGVIPEGEDGGDLERQTSLEERQKQYEGQPEMRKKMKVIFPALTIGVLLSAADQTIIVSSYGKIGSELKALNNVSWIATAYFLTLTSFQPLYGKMSDIFGRKSCLLFAYLVFGLGCLACGLAQNMNQLIAARAFAGIGGGGMTTVVSILMSDAVPLRERGKWQGYVNIIYATGAGTGAPLGGILADSIGWRWAFLGQVPLCVLAFVVVGSVLKLPKREQTDWKQKLRRIDFLGAAILICAVFTLLLALDRGSNVSWKANITIISISLSIPLFILFVFVEMKVASEPFAPGHIIFNRSLFACYLCNFFSFSGWLAALFYIPLYFQAVDGLTATQAGVRLIPGIIAGVSGSLFGGFYMQRTGKFYWLTVIAYTCLVVGMTTVFLFTGFVVNSTIGIIIGMCICGSGNGVGVTSTLIGLIANASREDQAVATACSYLFRSLGSVFGVSISATLANQSLRDNLASALSNGNAAAEIAERVRESLAYINTLEPGVRALVRECYAQSTRAAFGLEIGLVAGAAVSAWFIREKALSK